ncbi:MAG: PLP-dependent aminotransferase family protein [Leptolyngbyaceae cyanobacterium]
MKISPIALEDHQILYEQVAERLQTLITEKTLKAGDRLPSVRNLRQQLSVSTSTVLEAYRLLEDRGLITARPQSGYYVKATALHLLQEPSASAPLVQAHRVDTPLSMRLLMATQNPAVIQLGAALPPLSHMPLNQLNRLTSKVLRENPEAAHAYSNPLGDPGLRSALAKRMLDTGCAVSPEDLLVTNGAIEAIYLSLQALTQPGDTVAVESPTYHTMLEALKKLHLKVLTLPTHPREGISLSHLEAALRTQSIKAIMLVSNFSNPLGICMSDVKKKQLVALLNHYEVPLIEDDVYGELCFVGSRPKAVKAFDTEQRVIYCASLSKTLSPGLRIGWCVAGRYQGQVASLKSVVNLGTAIAPQLTAAAFLANGGFDRHLRQLRRAYQEQMARMQQAIADYFPQETRVTRPTGGHILWVEMPAEFDALALHQEALTHNISIVPGIMFSASGSDYQNCFRLNTGIPWSDQVDQAMQTLGQLAKVQLARHLLQLEARDV